MISKSLYIASHERAAGSLVVSMGLMEYLKGSMKKVAFFRPFVESVKYDHDINFFLKRYSLEMVYAQTYAFSVQEVEKLIAENRLTYLIEQIISKYKSLEEEFDFVLIEGIQKSIFSGTIDIDLNLEVAKNLGAPYIAVLSGKDKKPSDVLDDILIESKSIQTSGCTHFATFANRLDDETITKLSMKLSNKKGIAPTYLLKEIDELDMPTIMEIKNALECEVIKGDEKDFKKVVRHTKIAAMNLEDFLEHIKDGDLIIVPGDRADIITGAVLALFSKKHKSISGILLTGGIRPSKTIIDILNGFDEFPVPIMIVNDDTYQTAIKVDSIPATISPISERKIALAMGLFNSSVDLKSLENKILQTSSPVITPAMFEYSLFQKARKNKKTIVLPESSDDRVLRACEILLRRDIVDIILLGDKSEIDHKSSSLGIDVSNARVIDPNRSELTKQFAEKFYQLRKHKGMTSEAALDTVKNLSYFATMMVNEGVADGMVSGAIHTTGETIRPSLQIIKTDPDTPLVSSLFFMCLKTKVLVYADCAVNKDPSAEELAIIAISSATTAMQFGLDVKIAMLSYSTGSSGSGKDVEKVALATSIVKEKRPDLLIEGPIQYDAAVDKDVARVKLPKSKVAGEATIFIFPDLNTGNNTYKAVQRSSNAIAIGPVLQGLKKPVNDLSRGCLVADIVNTVAITAIQAGKKDLQ